MTILSSNAMFLLYLGAIWLAVLGLSSWASRKLRKIRSALQIELRWWRVDFHLACSSSAALGPRRLQRLLRKWFGLGAAAGLALGLYSCMLLVTELTLLLLRLGMEEQAEAQPTPSKLKLALPGVTLPLGHTAHILLALLVSMVLHEAGHALAASGEEVRRSGAGLSLTLLLPVAYVELDEGDLSRLPRWPALRVACAGAWHNVVLCALCWAGMAGERRAAGAAGLLPGTLRGHIALLLGYTGAVSAALGLLNMAPVHWLDGEKVVRALLEQEPASAGALPHSQHAQHAQHKRRPAWVRRCSAALRRLTARWLLHMGTAALAGVVVLHVACLRWCGPA